MKKVFSITAICGASITVVLLAAGAIALAEPLNGQGNWQSVQGEVIAGTWTVRLDREGDQITGSLLLTGSNVFSGGEVVGTIDRSSIALGVVIDGAEQATFAGKIKGGVIEGEWNAPSLKDEGVWYGSLRSPGRSPGTEN